MEELSIEYLAGFFDGEGCITICRDKCKGRSVHHKIKAIVVNTDLAILLEFKKRFGGAIGKGKQHTPRHKIHYYWSVVCLAAEEFLEAIGSYLTIKNRQAKLALEFQKAKTIIVPSPGNRMPEEELLLRESFYQAMHDLNHSP